MECPGCKQEMVEETYYRCPRAISTVSFTMTCHVDATMPLMNLGASVATATLDTGGEHHVH